jgi:AcrR family transcriptional regulator
MVEPSKFVAVEHRRIRSRSPSRAEAAETILDCAAILVSAKGLRDLTLAEPSVMAGCPRERAGRLFGKKEDFILAIAGRIADRYCAHLSEHASTQTGLGSVIEMIEGYFSAAAADPTTARASLIIYNESVLSPHLGSGMAKLMRRASEALQARLTAAQSCGDIASSADLPEEADMLLALMLTIVNRWLADPVRFHLPRASRILTDNLRLHFRSGLDDFARRDKRLRDKALH